MFKQLWLTAATVCALCATSPAQNTALANAHWIAAPASDPAMAEMPIFRRAFVVRKPIASATLQITGLGQYEASINGNQITQAKITPSWSNYRKRIYFATYDITTKLHRGQNAIGVMLGNGMYNVVKTPGRYTKFVGSFGAPKMIAHLDLKFTDGTHQFIDSDAAWMTAPGPIVFSSTYGGEDYDATREQSGWNTAGFDDHAWTHAALADSPGGMLMPERIEPIVLKDRYETQRITHPQDGVTIYDLGKNFAGFPEITVRGERGAKVTLLPGELLAADGTVTQRSAGAYPDRRVEFNYTLRGHGEETWSPRFTYYGFRYVEVHTTGNVQSLKIAGQQIHTDARTDGTFTSSSQTINQIHTLIDRAIVSNMMSVLTDCPHREKLGWLEEAHLMGASIMYNHHVAKLYAKIEDDMQDSQLENGMVPDIAPEFTVFKNGFRDSPEWGAAVVLAPWTAYQFYGDPAPLREHYASMKHYLEYLKSKSDNGYIAYGLGDWYDIGPKRAGISQLTSLGLTATGVYYQSLVAMQTIARVTGHTDDVAMWQQEAANVKRVFNEKLFHPDTNQYDRGSQTANAMPLVLGLVPQDRRAAVLANLVADIRAHKNHVTAGDVGFHYVVRALTDGGRSDVLFDMLDPAGKPSYGDQIAHGATTLTEAWDSDPRESQNHFMLGHAEEWFYRGLAGIDLDMSRGVPIRIAPSVVGDVTSASASYQSKWGKISSSWKLQDDTLTLRVTIPTGAEAHIVAPRGFDHAITKNGHPTEAHAWEVKSGTYLFTLKK
ncbi:MAG: family 78 glycoside hydrolase catalytic domain [Acidobacteria bacterium]|nr:family 78 glycoside hydrolase catalytic domain [Acidobacteriota bacterium]